MSMPLDAHDACKRVRSLLAQAADPSTTEEEARSFAHRAAKLMAKHRLTVTESAIDDDDDADAVDSDALGETFDSLLDLAGKVKQSGILDAFKRTVRAGSRATRARASRGSAPRRHR